METKLFENTRRELTELELEDVSAGRDCNLASISSWCGYRPIGARFSNCSVRTSKEFRNPATKTTCSMGCN